ncbi:MAG TPA: Cd(II)/Pb(II)-responsive transcriptional regulator [Burkholderiaceae bacterium]|nr:Cd(II)/Pb(II)-responsive transcriptional regulator [Burkholderiaceae bacterium]
MRIGEIVAATGVDVETVRYYEKAGLLAPPKRSTNGYRAYGPAQLERLAFIRHCRSLDVTIADIQRLLSLIDRPASKCRDVNDLVDTQLQRVRARLESLMALEKQLVSLRARCKAPKSARQCGILAELVHAAHGEACVCHGAKVKA